MAEHPNIALHSCIVHCVFLVKGRDRTAQTQCEDLGELVVVVDDTVNAAGEGSGYSPLVDGEYIGANEEAVIGPVGRHEGCQVVDALLLL